MAFAVFVEPEAFVVGVVVVDFVYDAAGPDVVGHFFYDIDEFEVVGEFGRDGFAAEQAAHNVAAYRSGGVAVAGVVYGTDDGVFE